MDRYEWAFIGILALCCFGVYSCTDSEWYARQEASRKAQEQREATPHVVREADGCKVYAFKAGDHYNYFTRCPDSRTTTESNRTVTCGKNCRRTETESIEVVR